MSEKQSTVIWANCWGQSNHSFCFAQCINEQYLKQPLTYLVNFNYGVKSSHICNWCLVSFQPNYTQIIITLYLFNPILETIYHKVGSSRPVYYSILDLLGQRSQYIRIRFPLHKQSENPWMCY